MRQLTVICSFLLILTACSRSYAATPEPPTYRVNRTQAAVRIDGIMTPGEWNDALKVPVNIEIEPAENAPAPVYTTAYLTYDEHRLLVAFVAEDPNPSAIRANIADRDSLWRDDFCGIAIDPFNDRRRGYEFFVNPHGVQGDLKRTEDHGEDASWDTIWDAAGRITETGYVVEFAIPFRSISFPNGTRVHTWGFWFFRAYPRAFRHQISNVPFDRDKNCFFCQISRATGFEGIHPGRNLEFNPTLTATRDQSREGFGEPVTNPRTTAQLGVNIRWAPTTNITLNATLNPDFSQVEADSAQLRFNRRFSLFFSEKRPFFLEGADIFETRERFVHTRTLADPSYGLKASGKSGKYAWGLFTAKDTITNILLPGPTGSSYVSWEQASTVTVGRVRRDIFSNSTIGALITHRAGGGYHNTVASVDGRIHFTSSDVLRFQLSTSDTVNPDVPDGPQLNGEALSGSSISAAFEHEDRNWDITLWHVRHDREFRADLGFIPQVDVAESGVDVDRVFYGSEGAFISRIIPSARVPIQNDLDGNRLSRTIHLGFNLQMAAQSYLGTFYDMEMRWHEGTNHYYANYGFWTGARFQKFAIHGMMGFGENVDYANNRLGNWGIRNLELSLFPTPRVQAEVNARRETMRELGQDLFTAHILQGRFVYNFSTRLFIRTILQYVTLERNPALYPDLDNRISRSLFPQVLLSYKVNPRTLLYLGYSGNREATELDPMQTFQRTLFFKIAYAWRL